MSRRQSQGYDLDVIIQRSQDAPYLPSKPAFQRFWAVWGCKIKQKTWKRPKVFTRIEYITLLIAIIPGIWFHDLNKYIIEYGAAVTILVVLLAVLVSAPLIFAETFIADYTKAQTTTYWGFMRFSFCFLPMQLFGGLVEALQGCIRSIIYLNRFAEGLKFSHGWRVCPKERLEGHVCYDSEIHVLSKRCRPGGMWIVCPDNMSYILPSHYHFINECNEASYSIWNIIYMGLHWTIVGYISYKGVRTFVQTIMWCFLGIMLMHLANLLMMIYKCGLRALQGVAILVSFEGASFLNMQLWRAAFVVAMDIATWGLPMNCYVTTGLLFRTNRWNDIALVISIGSFAAILLSASSYSVIGCLAHKINARIEAIWRTKNSSPTDVILAYYFSDFSLGPIFIALHNMSIFLIYIWSMAALAEALVLSIVEPCDLLKWQTTVLILFTGMSVPLTAYIVQYYSDCDVTMETDFSRAIISLRLLNGTAYSIVIFWIKGVQNLIDDHRFMYGHIPLTYIWKMWQVLPLLFIVMCILDFQDSLSGPDGKAVISSLYMHGFYFLMATVGLAILIFLHIRQKVLNQTFVVV